MHRAARGAYNTALTLIDQLQPDADGNSTLLVGVGLASLPLAAAGIVFLRRIFDAQDAAAKGP